MFKPRFLRRVSIICLVFAVAGFSQAAHSAQDPEIVIRPGPSSWNSVHAVPFSVDIRTRRGGEFRISGKTSDYRSSSSVFRTVSVPPNSSTRVELELVGSGYSTIEVHGGGATGVASQSGAQHVDGPFIACVNSYYLREIAALPETDKPGDLRQEGVPLDELPGRWQSYAGYSAVMVFDAAEARKLRQDQRVALVVWVRWLGGCVALVGENAYEVARELGFEFGTDNRPAGAPLRRFRAANGVVLVQTSADPAAFIRALPERGSRGPLAPFYAEARRSYYGSGGDVLDSLTGISTYAIITTLAILGLVMGPLNYLYIRKRKNSLLFFITTPLIAFLGTVCVVGASMWNEGLGAAYNQRAILARDVDSGEAFLIDIRGVNPGLFAPALRFPGDAFAASFGGYGSGDGADLITDVSDGLVLAGGWLRPRFASGYVIARPVVSRMNLDLAREGDDWLATNESGHSVIEVAARLPDGSYAWAERVPAGGRATLRADASARSRFFRLREEMMGSSSENDNSFAGMILIAKCSGLPYMDDGGLGGTALNAVFFHCLVGGLPGGDGQ